jgi:hypothetical protein
VNYPKRRRIGKGGHVALDPAKIRRQPETDAIDPDLPDEMMARMAAASR